MLTISATKKAKHMVKASNKGTVYINLFKQHTFAGERVGKPGKAGLAVAGRDALDGGAGLVLTSVAGARVADDARVDPDGWLCRSPVERPPPRHARSRRYARRLRVRHGNSKDYRFFIRTHEYFRF